MNKLNFVFPVFSVHGVQKTLADSVALSSDYLGFNLSIEFSAAPAIHHSGVLVFQFTLYTDNADREDTKSVV